MPYQLFIFAIPAMIFFLRFLMQFTGCDYYNPVCRVIATITSPFLKLTSFIPVLRSHRNIHIGALLWTFALGIAGYSILFLYQDSFALLSLYDIIFKCMFICVVSLFFTFWAIVNTLFFLLIICGILSWIPSLGVWNTLLRQLTSPVVEPFERFIPPIGVISLSFMVAFLLVSFVNYTAFPYLIEFIYHIMNIIYNTLGQMIK